MRHFIRSRKEFLDGIGWLSCPVDEIEILKEWKDFLLANKHADISADCLGRTLGISATVIRMDMKEFGIQRKRGGANNKRMFFYKKKPRSITEIASMIKMPYGTLYKRIVTQGMTINQALRRK